MNVWCSVLGNKLIRSFVFDNNLTGNAYEVFLQNELPSLLEDIPLMIQSQMYFQHDGAPPHYTRHMRDYVNESFPNRWLGRGGPVAWPPRSPDLTPLDYYLCGHMKTLVYETSSTARCYFCSGRIHTQPSKQHCFRYSIHLDACRKLNCSWWMTL